MCILIANGETLATGLSHAAAIREARVAAQLLGTTVTIFDLKTRRTTLCRN